MYEEAARLKSDGCSFVPDFYIIACLDHDIGYRTHADIFGDPLTKVETDLKFRWAIQHESILGRFSPMSYWRSLLVSLFGQRAWDAKQSLCYSNIFGGLSLARALIHSALRTPQRDKERFPGDKSCC